MQGYDQEYYDRACIAKEDLKYYMGDLKGDCLAYLLRYFPDTDEKELLHAIDWALTDTWGS